MTTTTTTTDTFPFGGPKGWCYGIGLPGCLFDNVAGPFETFEEACDAAAYDVEDLVLVENGEDASETVLNQAINEALDDLRNTGLAHIGRFILEIFDADNLSVDDWENGLVY